MSAYDPQADMAGALGAAANHAVPDELKAVDNFRFYHRMRRESHNNSSAVAGGQMNIRPLSIVCGSALIAAASSAAFAADMVVKAPAPPPAVWDWSGFYGGVGGSFNWTHFDQSLQGVSGNISVFDGPTLVAQGQEGGPFFDFNRNKPGFAPDVQFGYMAPVASGGWLAGFKFTYKYANIDSKEVVSVPQNGTGAILSGPGAGTSGPITGFVQISPAEINLKHQFSLIATIGHSFGDFTVYAGGGPALFGVETNFFDTIPFATSSLSGTFPAGAPITVLNSNWVWGGAAQIGTMYALTGGWFLDFSYTYARSANFNIENSVLVQNQIGSVSLSGPGVLNTQEQITNQSVELTLNYKFR
jgi:opacity protein-like surface antigen